MPYFIFNITQQPFRMLTKLEQHDVYREAAARARALRAELPEGSNAIIKMVHAEDEIQAEDLLNEVREPQPELGDD